MAGVCGDPAPEYGRRYEELFGFADAALYEAKRRGRDMQVFYTKDIQAGQRKNKEENTIMQERQAFLTNPQVFIFQMLYETGDARITVETLLALFAKYFMVQRVVIYQQKRGQWVCWFEWHADGYSSAEAAHDGAAFEYINNSFRKEIYGTFSECPDSAKLEGEAGKILAERNCYKVVTDSNRPCVRCKHFKLRGKCPVGLRLKHDGEQHGLTPFSVLWEGDGESNVFVDNI